MNDWLEPKSTISPYSTCGWDLEKCWHEFLSSLFGHWSRPGVLSWNVVLVDGNDVLAWLLVEEVALLDDGSVGSSVNTGKALLTEVIVNCWGWNLVPFSNGTPVSEFGGVGPFLDVSTGVGLNGGDAVTLRKFDGVAVVGSVS